MTKTKLLNEIQRKSKKLNIIYSHIMATEDSSLKEDLLAINYCLDIIDKRKTHCCSKEFY